MPEEQDNAWAIAAAGLGLAFEKLVKAGLEMRAAQKEYFRNRQRAALERGKALERAFDRLLEEIMAAGKRAAKGGNE